MHKVVAPYTCTYCGNGEPVCEDVFCDICIYDRKRICAQIGSDQLLFKMNKFLCKFHFDKLANKVFLEKKDILPESLFYKGNKINVAT